MSVESLIKLFEQYGWPGIMAVICILIVYYFITKKDKNSINTINTGFTSLTNTITTQNETLVKAITTSNEKTQEHLFALISKSIDDKEYEKREKHRKSIAKREEIGDKIDDILYDILQETHAQRVIMVEFHNSKENLDGLSFLWYDIQHEKQQKGVDTISAKARNLQAINLRPIVKRVNNDKHHIVTLDEKDIEDIYKESTVLYAHLKEINVSHLIYVGIYNTDSNELLGIVGIEFQGTNPYHEDLVDYYQLKEQCSIIEHLYNQARIDLLHNDDDSISD